MGILAGMDLIIIIIKAILEEFMIFFHCLNSINFVSVKIIHSNNQLEYLLAQSIILLVFIFIKAIISTFIN